MPKLISEEALVDNSDDKLRDSDRVEITIKNEEEEVDRYRVDPKTVWVSGYCIDLEPVE